MNAQKHTLVQVNTTVNIKLTFVEAGEVEPLFSGTPHQQTPRFFRGIGDRILPCQCHLLPR